MDTSPKGKKEYGKVVDKLTPDSKLLENGIKAFVTGGIICVLGQLMKNGFSDMGFDEDSVALLTNMVFIGTAVLLTGFGLYSKIGKFCGAGTIVPITGFANSMASSSIEGKSEGLIMGLGASMFNVAGPVIVYGLASSILVGFVYYTVK